MLFTVFSLTAALILILPALNIFEHRTLFLTFRKEHHTLPPHVALPFARKLQERVGQKIRA